ncbi:hypothetical protein KFK09_002203 [Dendrobium nobile]|uniref:Tf2-1-like SH3-like domain-containing protein n=1 Tax=Dendrobium nobile TaxID=94219 RepID=A0A8T3CBM2_DENNO|nr:hypothetical protein KFK09_002203 [Dendrobium nobile]
MLSTTEFAYNSMVNRSTGKSPFNIVYTKVPNLALDVAVLPKCRSEMATKFTTKYSDMLKDVRKKLHQSNQSYKAYKDLRRREKLFHVGDLVMVRLCRERFPPGTYSNLSRRKIGPFPITTKINDNAYIADLPASYNTSSLSMYMIFGLITLQTAPRPPLARPSRALQMQGRTDAVHT